MQVKDGSMNRFWAEVIVWMKFRSYENSCTFAVLFMIDIQ
jgi:hypothetical protein